MPSAASTTITTSTPSLVGKSEVDVELLLPGGSLEVHHGLFFLGIRLLLVFLLVDSRLLHLGSTSEPSPAFRRLNLGPSFLACMAFHSSRVICFSSSSLASFASSSSAVSSLGALGSSSTAA